MRLGRVIFLFAFAAALSACAGTGGSPAGGGGSSAEAVGTASPAIDHSIGHEHALLPMDPSVSLPSYGYYATAADPPIQSRPFTLTDDMGESFRFDPTAGGSGMVTLLYFGYTNCPDVCPSELATIATALDRLPDRIAHKVRMVFVTVDPGRDDVARMHEYVELFDPAFVGLTGPGPTTQRVLLDLGLPAAKKLGEEGDYAMRHPAEVLAFTRDGDAHLVFPFGLSVIAWQHDLWKLVNEGWREPT